MWCIFDNPDPIFTLQYSALQEYYKYTINEEGALQPLLLLIAINSFSNMYYYLQTL